MLHVHDNSNYITKILQSGNLPCIPKLFIVMFHPSVQIISRCNLPARCKLAFSLVELLIVIAIIAILFSSCVPLYNQYIRKARIAELFIVADVYKFKLLEKIINNELIAPEAAVVIYHPNRLITKVEYAYGNHNRYEVNLTTNMDNLKIQPINDMPFTIKFIAEEDQDNNLVTWKCECEDEYRTLIKNFCPSNA